MLIQQKSMVSDLFPQNKLHFIIFENGLESGICCLLNFLTQSFWHTVVKTSLIRLFPMECHNYIQKIYHLCGLGKEVKEYEKITICMDTGKYMGGCARLFEDRRHCYHPSRKH